MAGSCEDSNKTSNPAGSREMFYTISYYKLLRSNLFFEVTCIVDRHGLWKSIGANVPYTQETAMVSKSTANSIEKPAA